MTDTPKRDQTASTWLTTSLDNRSRVIHASTSTCNQAFEKGGLARRGTLPRSNRSLADPFTHLDRFGAGQSCSRPGSVW